MNFPKRMKGLSDIGFIVVIFFVLGIGVAILITTSLSEYEREQKMIAGCVERGFATGVRLGEGWGSNGYFACVDKEGLPRIIGNEYIDPVYPTLKAK
jgi:hypothetical protein